MKKNNNKKLDPKYLGIPNINFSLTREDDDRELKYSKQRKERGFDDSETWSLRDTIANFIVPRMIRYKELLVKTECRSGWDGEEDPNGNILDEIITLEKIIKAFELIKRNDGSFMLSPEEEREYEEGIELFSDFFLSLWW
jgi:hypothetical protein